jgi:hypothetical protein
MSKVSKGDTVRLVRAAVCWMQADRRNIGKHGEVTEVIRDGSLTYYEVTLSNGVTEHAEAQALTIVRRCTRTSSKRELQA